MERQTGQTEHTSTAGVKKPPLITPRRVAVLCAVYVLVCLTVYGLVMAAHHAFLNEIRRSAKDLASMLAAQVDPAKLAKIHTLDDMRRPEFAEIWRSLRKARDSFHDIKYVYTLRPRPDLGKNQWSFIVDAAPMDEDLNRDGVISPEETGSPPGAAYNSDDVPAMNEALTTATAAADYYTDFWGTFISGFAPVTDPATSATIAILGVDVTKQAIAAKYRIVNYAGAGALAALLSLITLTFWALYGKTQSLEVIRELDKVIHAQNIELREKNELLNRTVNELSEREQIMSHDLSLAQEVQQRLLPYKFPFEGALQFAASYRACAIIGGDLYDTFAISDHVAGFYIADASGHGVSAALVMAALKVSIDRYRQRMIGRSLMAAMEPNALLAEKDESALRIFINKIGESITQALSQGSFVTMLFGVVDTKSGSGLIVNAGHNRPILWQGDHAGARELPLAANVPLGVISGYPYEVARFAMNPGDKLILYTDGVIDLANDAGDQFGSGRLMEIITGFAAEKPRTLVDEITNHLDRFRANTPAGDDQSLLVIERL